MLFNINKEAIKYILISIIAFSFTEVRSQNDAIEPKDTLIFAVITDTHVGKDNNTQGLEIIVQDLNRRKEISFVVNTGDVTDFGTEAEMEDLHLGMAKLTMPWYIVPGNHDTGWSGSAGLSFSAHFEDQKFVAEVDGYKLIGLSTGPYTRMSRGYVPTHQLEWLDSIASSKDHSQPVLFFTHMPLDEKNMSNYPEVISKLKKMTAVIGFNGHGHINKIIDYDDDLKGIMTQTAQDRNSQLVYNIFYLTGDSITAKSIDARTGLENIWMQIPVSVNHTKAVDAISNNEPQGKQPTWAIKDNSNILTRPAASNDLLFAGNLKGEFKAYSQKTGVEKWIFKTREAILSSPAIKDERVVFGSADSTVYCLNASTGKMLWKLKTEGSVLASPVIHKGKVYIGSSDFHYRAIDLESGKLIWKSDEIKGFPPGKPAIANGKIIFGTWEKMLYALNLENGKRAWEWELTGKSHYYSPAMCTPFVYDQRVHIVTPDNILRTFDINSGILLNEEEGYMVRESIGGDTSSGILVAKTMQDTVAIWNVRETFPKIVKAFNVGFGKDFSPSDVVFDGDLAFFGTTFGEVYAIDTKKHTLKWKSKISNAMVNTPQVLSRNRLLVTSEDGGIFLFTQTHLSNDNLKNKQKKQ